jgi:hypothetical protein
MIGKVGLLHILKFTRLYKIILAKRKFMNTFRRYRLAKAYYNENLKLIRGWSRKNTEDSNFYYELTQHNLLYLAHFVGIVTDTTPEVALQYFSELEENMDLKRHIQNKFAESNYEKDVSLHFGRRIGWYAITRITKPKVVVETGVDHGVGACILTAALLMNKEEGFSGQYFGTDISHSAGQLLTGKYCEVGKILYGDSIQSLISLVESINLFINDSDHSSEYEYREYQAIRDKLSKHAIILGDNAHNSDSLAKFSLETSRNFHFFKEVPKNHWYPGAGIGASIER